MASTDVKITVSATDIEFVKDIIEAAIKVVLIHDQHGLEDESIGSAIHALDTALGDACPR